MESAYESVIAEYSNILSEYYRVKGKRGKSTPHMSWSVIPFARLNKIWQDYAKTGIVRDTSGMESIKHKMLEILARLHASNDLAGHGSGVSDEDISEYTGMKMPKGDNTDFYFNFLETDYGSPISDYGLDKLWAIAQLLMRESSPERQLLLCDQMLNVVHQRGDLAALFVEGGSSSLDQLAQGHLENNPVDPEAVKIWEDGRRGSFR